MSDYLYKYIGSPVASVAKIFTKSKSTTTTTANEQAKKVADALIDTKPKPFNYNQLPLQSKNLLRLAGLSGLTAVILSAYGSHVFKRKNADADLRELYNTAQYYHLVHSVALLGLPLVKRPMITGSLWLSGMFIFCGSMYYHALTHDSSLKMLTPYGGFCLIAGWLSIII